MGGILFCALGLLAAVEAPVQGGCGHECRPFASRLTVVGVVPFEPLVACGQVVTPRPSPEHRWLAAYWDWRGPECGYVWTPGRWAVAPEPGLVWEPPRWVPRRGVYYWREGVWGPPPLLGDPVIVDPE